MFRSADSPSSVCVTDDEVVLALGGSTHQGIDVVFLNTCTSWDVCLRLQAELGIPVVVGWEGPAVPSQHCVQMVRCG